MRRSLLSYRIQPHLIMKTIAQSLALFGLLCMALPQPLLAQQQETEPPETAYATERSLVESALQTVVAVIQEVTLKHSNHTIGEQLRQMANRLSSVTTSLSPTPNAPPSTSDADDLKELERLLIDLSEQLDRLRDDLLDEDEDELADRLMPISRGLDDAVRTVRRMNTDDTADTRVAVSDSDGFLRPGRYGDRTYEPDRDEDDEWDDGWERDRRERTTVRRTRNNDRYRHRIDWRNHTHASAFVGDLTSHWPYRENASYNTIPAIRYNRVEGLVLGIGENPMEWDSYNRAKVYGQVGYSFGLDDWRYQVGAETRFGRRYGNTDADLKVGGSYRHNTDTKDLWKSSWAENSLAAFFFEHDFFDYYEVEGWEVHAVARLSPFIQVSGAYRDEEYRSLRRNTSWSLFGGDAFRFNPPIDEGRMESVVLALEGGSVRGLYNLPRGTAFRLEAELGDSFGGDFAFNRYLGDVRLYLPFGRVSSLSLRFRGGLATGDEIPWQKTFTLGGVGSVRAYPQNIFGGTHMLLGNAEYAFYELEIFDSWVDDFQFFGLFDAGWVSNEDFDTFDFDDVIPAAGFGVGLDDRFLRLELAWPLRDLGGGNNPTLWLRLNPTF